MFKKEKIKLKQNKMGIAQTDNLREGSGVNKQVTWQEWKVN